jgi:hypothetical protein
MKSRMNREVHVRFRGKAGVKFPCLTRLQASLTDDTTTNKRTTLNIKETLILTGDQRHTDHISNGQQLSRHSLPSLLYFLFSQPHIFFNSILASLTSGTFGFALTHKANPSQNQKSHFLPTPSFKFDVW